MIAILGGGITGVAAAVALKKAGKEFILVEASDSLGGKIGSEKVENGFVELGPNTVLINNAEVEEFLKDLELWDELIFADAEILKHRYVLKEGKAEPIPHNFSSMLSSKLIKWSTFWAILTEVFKKKRTNANDESLADFVRRRFNKQILSDLVTPFVSGIYAGDPEKMSVSHTLAILKEAEEKSGSVILGMPKILKERKRQRSWDPPKNKIFSFKEGLQTIFRKAEKILEPNLSLRSKVHSIQKEEDRYKISYQLNGNSKDIFADQIISTTPAHVLAEFIEDNELKAVLNGVNYAPAVVTHIAINKKQLKFDNSAFGILSRKEEQEPFLGILFNSHFFHHQSAKDQLILTVISGGYKNPEMLEWPEEKIRSSIAESLERLELIEGQFNLLKITKWKKAIPQYELGYSYTLTEIKEFEKKNDGFYIAGNFYKGISVSDCISNGIKLANQIH